MEAARRKIVGFLDDDNLPAEDWVTKAYEFAKSHLLYNVWLVRLYHKINYNKQYKLSCCLSHYSSL